METKWFDDFLSLAETRSFSKSAQLRHITQPAFSRRIQALEAWAGLDLVDRTSYRIRLTPAGEILHSQAVVILRSLDTTRKMMRELQAASDEMIEFAATSTLAFTFFPNWVMGLRRHFGAMKSRLTALNIDEATVRMAAGSCDWFCCDSGRGVDEDLSRQRSEGQRVELVS